MKIALLGLSPDVPDSTIGQLASGARIYAKIVAKQWERSVPKIEFMPGLKVAPDGWIAAIFAAKMDDANALAYHSVDPRGMPYMLLCLDVIPGKVIYSDPSGRGESLAGAFTHELAETMDDEAANLWAQGETVDPSTNEKFPLAAREACDAVQGFSFPVQIPGGPVMDGSDFLYRDFFNAALIGAAEKPLSHVAYLTGGKSGATKAFQTTPGGYQSVAKIGSDGQVFAMGRVFHADVKPSNWREEMREHPSRRGHRRAAAILGRRIDPTPPNGDDGDQQGNPGDVL